MSAPENPQEASAMNSPSTIDPSTLEVGTEIGRREHTVSRDTLVRYAGASGDFNPIHYNDAVAISVGLDGVIAHGMLTMGTAVAVVAEWAGDPSAITAYSVRFTKPFPVPAEGSATLTVTAVIGAIDTAAGTVRVDLTAEAHGVKVLGRARATVAVGSVRPEAVAGEAA